jgi:hypothetical protein
MSSTIVCQKRNGVFVPYLPEDVSKCDEYKENQLTTHKVTGVRKERSYPQLKMLHAALKTVVENTENKNWNTIEKAKLSLKVALNYIDQGVVIVDPQGNVIFKYRSFGYADLQHMDACKLFDRAFPILAAVIGVAEDVLLAEARRE